MRSLATSAIASVRLHAGVFASALSDSGYRHHAPLLHLLLSFGLIGILLVSIVDSSFVPLPIPGISDIMVVLFAAQHANLFPLIGAATVGSFLGGALSYQVGRSGGMSFLEKHVPARIFKRVCNWMQSHAILSVALPAILPPPMPLSPFVLAAGALKMSRQRFLAAFTLSRLLRHSTAAALGVYYGPQVLHLWNRFSRKWALPILIAIWAIILLSVAMGFWKIYKTSRSLAAGPVPDATPSATLPSAQT